MARVRRLASSALLLLLAGCGTTPGLSGQDAEVTALRRHRAEPLTRVAPEYRLDTSAWGKMKAYAEIARERGAAGAAPGHHQGLNATSKDDPATLASLRTQHPEEASMQVVGPHQRGGRIIMDDVPAPDGNWEAFRYAPTCHYDAQEDSYPVLPGFDGDRDPGNDATTYAHGQVGGRQPVTMVCSISQKGDYHVLQYSSYYVDNKVATGYHVNDSSTIAVYLHAGSDGRLAPAYLYTTWHFGAILAPWSEVALDATGHPQVMVGRGSHALWPLGRGKHAPEDGGLVVRGDGSMALRGRGGNLPNRLLLATGQTSLRGSQTLDPATSAGEYALQLTFGWYPVRTNPYHPGLFQL